MQAPSVSKAFTLVEVLLTLAVLSVLFALTVPAVESRLQTMELSSQSNRPTKV